MNGFCQWLSGLLSRMLDPAERTAVEGDLIESGESGPEALRDVLGILIRRQLAAWKSWQPWLALLGVAVISGLVLSAAAFNLRVGIDHRMLRYLMGGPYSHPDLAAGREIEYLVCLTLAFFAWTWTSGFVLATLSRRAFWITGLTFYVVVLTSFLARLLIAGAIKTESPIIGDRVYPLWLVFVAFLLPLSPSKLLFVIAFFWGARTGLRNRALNLWRAVTQLAAVAITTALVVWTGGWYEQTHSLIVPWIGTSPKSWSGGIWHEGLFWTRLLPLLLVSWPAGYLLAASRNQRIRHGFHGRDMNL